MDYIIIALFAFFVLYKINRVLIRKSRRKYIQNYQFKPLIQKRLAKTYPHLNEQDTKLVFKALREYFELSLQSQNQLLAMPSQVVDVAWHEFILTTREYSKFCKEAFGSYLHHTPTEVMASKQKAQASIKRIWKMACQREGINPLQPATLPLLFGIDAMLDIEDGFKYALKCDPTKGEYCASHIACAGDSHAGDTGDNGTDGSSGDGGGCSGGCGGG
ncbi:MAG: hypothetical protein JXQ76_09555 [Campylobacterales bacterium]|nr:hypothetical protein [Campylobacterales bacterium]